MNNSLARLLDGMVSTIDEHIIPNIQDDFARGQAFGVIYMLRCIRKRAAWSTSYLQPQVDAFQDVSSKLRSLLSDLDGMPTLAAVPPLAAGCREAALEQARDEANRAMCATYDWFEQHHDSLPAALAGPVREALERYLTTQLKTELRYNVNLNFSEISTGQAMVKPGATP